MNRIATTIISAIAAALAVVCLADATAGALTVQPYTEGFTNP